MRECSDMGGARGLGADGKIKAASAKWPLLPCLHITFWGAVNFELAPKFSDFLYDSMYLGGAKSCQIPPRHAVPGS